MANGIWLYDAIIKFRVTECSFPEGDMQRIQGLGGQYAQNAGFRRAIYTECRFRRAICTECRVQDSDTHRMQFSRGQYAQSAGFKGAICK